MEYRRGIKVKLKFVSAHMAVEFKHNLSILPTQDVSVT